jgi:hypothetical protein
MDTEPPGAADATAGSEDEEEEEAVTLWTMSCEAGGERGV